ncbi:hypothetical protein PV11_04071 [Exophiala sideris]|uniref:Uncharacterized protein n=1 Tax=Exophiala sideris TaxID=1016849 RepID=A0A0D1YLI8_9EURO|nr:hypothetical protein PV11_04071 [Exophiala sideris]
MCRLFIPICPLVLHCSAYPNDPNQHDIQPKPSADAKLLLVYLTKRPDKGLLSSEVLKQSKLKSKAWEKAKLYDRTTWHTCPCFFKSVSILHPPQGHSKPVMRPSLPTCAECSEAAKLLRPWRMGGLAVPRFVTSPLYDRCTFSPVSGVLEEGRHHTERMGYVAPLSGRQHGSQLQAKSEPPDDSNGEASAGNQRGGSEYHDRSSTSWPTKTQETIRLSQPRISYFQRDLDSYLAETYGSPREPVSRKAAPSDRGTATTQVRSRARSPQRMP